MQIKVFFFFSLLNKCKMISSNYGTTHIPDFISGV